MNQEELHHLIKQQQPNICQIVAYKAGQKVFSDCWNDYKPDDCTHIMSATKSIMACFLEITSILRQKTAETTNKKIRMIHLTKTAHDCGIPKGLEPLWRDSKGQRPLVGPGAKPRWGPGQSPNKKAGCIGVNQ